MAQTRGIEVTHPERIGIYIHAFNEAKANATDGTVKILRLARNTAHKPFERFVFMYFIGENNINVLVPLRGLDKVIVTLVLIVGVTMAAGTPRWSR